MSDDVLATEAAHGHHASFEALAVRYQARIYRLCCRLVGVDDAPDVAQETFLAAFRHIHSFRGDAKFTTWLYRIATNAALMHQRARGRRPVESLEQYLPSFENDGSHCGSPAALRVLAEIDEHLDRQRIAEKARAALDALPETHRSAFVLRDLEELPTAEVAEVLGIEPAAVRQRVHRARLMLRGYLAALIGATR